MMQEQEFYTRAEAWLMRTLEQNPVAATNMGDHRWDDRLSDNRPEAIAQQHEEMVAALEEARLNVKPASVPRVWAETALQQAKQAPGLFVGLLPAIAAQAAPELQADFEESGKTAAEAIQAYSTYIEEEILPHASDEFAAGRELFDELLHETRAQMEAVAQEIDPERSVREILEDAKADHPTAEGLLDAYRQSMAKSRQYVIDHNIASIPPRRTPSIASVSWRSWTKISPGSNKRGEHL